MSEHHDHEHHYSGNGHYPGADTHQSGWVMWVTLAGSSTFISFVLTISYLVGGSVAKNGAIGLSPTMIVGCSLALSAFFWAIAIINPSAQPKS